MNENGLIYEFRNVNHPTELIWKDVELKINRT